MIWAPLLPFLSLVLPAVAMLVLVLQVVRVLRRRRLYEAVPQERWVELAATAGAIGCVAYGVGIWAGHLIDPRAADEICGGQVSRALIQSPLPLRNVCQLTNGVSVNLVPGWVNPSVGLAAALVLTCSILALRSSSRRSLKP